MKSAEKRHRGEENSPCRQIKVEPSSSLFLTQKEYNPPFRPWLDFMSSTKFTLDIHLYRREQE